MNTQTLSERLFLNIFILMFSENKNSIGHYHEPSRYLQVCKYQVFYKYP